MNTEEFIARAKAIHGDKYDYSKVEYVNAKTKVCIICPEHGEFWQAPSGHLQGKGCKKCANKQNSERLYDTIEGFIKKAREVHGDKYDYSKVEYVDSKTKVCILCPEHGEFWQTPGSHLNGSAGCPKCSFENTSRTKRLTTDNFIRKAREVHGDKYDYSKVEYIDSHSNVCIICPEHGEFWQTPNNHFNGKGCPICGNELHKHTKEEFIAKALEVHGNKYDYSKVEYVDTMTKVCIICPKHGEFWQTPFSNLRGNGCPICAIEKMGDSLRMGNEEFIRRAKEVHGDNYDYSKVEYVNVNTKVCIICPEHGEFWQTPAGHLKGRGCPVCNDKRLTVDEFISRAKEIHSDKYDYSKVEYVNSATKVCIICPEHGEFWQSPNSHLMGHGCPNCHYSTKQYKFNLLEEFKDEYEFRSFLENNDENILYIILRNIEPKYEPIKKDIEKALDRSFDENPIKALEEKYSSDSDDEIDDNESWAESETKEEPVIDLDDDDAVSAMMSSDSETAETVQAQPTIEDVIKNTEQEIKVINKIEHLLTPEDRKYIMDKFLADKRRAWMLKREERV